MNRTKMIPRRQHQQQPQESANMSDLVIEALHSDSRVLERRSSRLSNRRRSSLRSLFSRSASERTLPVTNASDRSSELDVNQHSRRNLFHRSLSYRSRRSVSPFSKSSLSSDSPVPSDDEDGYESAADVATDMYKTVQKTLYQGESSYSSVAVSRSDEENTYLTGAGNVDYSTARMEPPFRYTVARQKALEREMTKVRGLLKHKNNDREKKMPARKVVAPVRASRPTIDNPSLVTPKPRAKASLSGLRDGDQVSPTSIMEDTIFQYRNIVATPRDEDEDSFDELQWLDPSSERGGKNGSYRKKPPPSL